MEQNISVPLSVTEDRVNDLGTSNMLFLKMVSVHKWALTMPQSLQGATYKNIVTHLIS